MSLHWHSFRDVAIPPPRFKQRIRIHSRWVAPTSITSWDNFHRARSNLCSPCLFALYYIFTVNIARKQQFPFNASTRSLASLQDPDSAGFRLTQELFPLHFITHSLSTAHKRRTCCSTTPLTLTSNHTQTPPEAHNIYFIDYISTTSTTSTHYGASPSVASAIC